MRIITCLPLAGYARHIIGACIDLEADLALTTFKKLGFQGPWHRSYMLFQPRMFCPAGPYVSVCNTSERRLGGGKTRRVHSIAQYHHERDRDRGYLGRNLRKEQHPEE